MALGIRDTGRQRLAQADVASARCSQRGLVAQELSLRQLGFHAAPMVMLLVFILGSNGLRDVLPHGVAEGGAVLGSVGGIQRVLHGLAPALAVVAVLKLRLYPRPCPLERVALLELLGQLGLEVV